LATDGLGPQGSSLDWWVAPVGDAKGDGNGDDKGDSSRDEKPSFTEDMGPVLQALDMAGYASRHLDLGGWLNMLEREKPTLAIVNPPFHLIGTVIKACLLRGIHVFAEKPLAILQAELAEIRALSQAPGAAKVMAMLTMRYVPAFLTAQHWVAAGNLGKIVSIRAFKSYPLMGWDGKPRPRFYHARETYGGTIPWIGIHSIDLFRWFTRSAFTEVRAAHSTHGNKDHGEMEIAATLDFKLASGAIASAQLDFLHPGKSGTWGDDYLRVTGEKGKLEIDEGEVLVDIKKQPRRSLTLEPVPTMFSAFLSWVQEDTPMLLTTEDGFLAAEAALLARDAADQKRTMTF
jgi:predicted dehydrogenase